MTHKTNGNNETENHKVTIRDGRHMMRETNGNTETTNQRVTL